MKKQLTIASFSVSIFFMFTALQTNGQAKDEALKKIENYKKNDSTKVEMLIDYCVNSTFSNVDKNLEFAKQALLISNKINYAVGKIRAVNCLGNFYYQQAIYDKATFYYTTALKLAE